MISTHRIYHLVDHILSLSLSIHLYLMFSSLIRSLSFSLLDQYMALTPSSFKSSPMTYNFFLSSCGEHEMIVLYEKTS